MMRKTILLIVLFLHSVISYAQKDISSFIFGHSLINHEFQVNPTPSQETSIPHWIHFLSESAGNSFKVSGQYGFLPQHANLPPMAQWGFDFVEGAWDSDNEPFSEANFDNIIITPGNFIQWQSPSENYPMENVSPLSATQQIFDWCNQQEDNLNFYVYENWPDMAPFLNNGFPPSQNEWIEYNQYLNEEFHNWYVEYHDALIESFPNSCVKTIPVGTMISELLNNAPFDEIPIDALYEDDAPHGRASLYFLASLISYMAVYEEKAPLDYEVQAIIHPIITANYATIVESFWTQLNLYNDINGESLVFCNTPTSSSLTDLINQNSIKLNPNPVTAFLNIETPLGDHYINILDPLGQTILTDRIFSNELARINLNELAQGLYILVGIDKEGKLLYSKNFIKQ